MKLRKWLSLLLLLALLTGCTESVIETVPTLPPISPDEKAPVGDAGLRYEAIATLYLPSKNGTTLLAQYQPLTLTHEQHPAETVLRALMAHPGNEQVRSLAGYITLSFFGANPVEVAGGVCTVNLSASALQLSQEELYTAALAMASTLCELDGIDYMTLLVAGTPVAMDISGCLPLEAMTSAVGLELSVLWEQLAARRAPVGTVPTDTALTATAALYHPLAAGGVTPSVRRLTFPGQDASQQVQTLLEALSASPSLSGASDLPALHQLLLEPPLINDLNSGGKRATLRFAPETDRLLTESGCDIASVYAGIVLTLTTFVPSLQQVCILLGEDGLTSLHSNALGSMLFPGALHKRSDYAHALRTPLPLYLPDGNGLGAHWVSAPWREAFSLRKRLILLSSYLELPMTDADILGLSVTGDTLHINLSTRWADALNRSDLDERLIAFSLVDTLCKPTGTRRTRISFGSGTLETLRGDLCWSGEFYYDPGLIAPEEETP